MQLYIPYKLRENNSALPKRDLVKNRNQSTNQYSTIFTDSLRGTFDSLYTTNSMVYPTSILKGNLFYLRIIDLKKSLDVSEETWEHPIVYDQHK